MTLILHSYWRSGAAYRVRIALNLKGLSYQQLTHDLRQDAQSTPEYRVVNPQGLVPALEVDDVILTQSPAILEWLEERHADPPLLPQRLTDRAVVRAMAAIVTSDIHPLNNLRVLKQLRLQFKADADAEKHWIAQWITAGFDTLEGMVHRYGRGFSFGDHPTLADCCLVPQVYSANRFGVDMSPYPSLRATVAALTSLPAVADAHPDNQPDADN
jgi:maleylpyruvate isomerase